MAAAATPTIGMSVGATTLAAVTADRAITREPVLTLYRNRSSQVGVPDDSPADGEADACLVFTGFVGRVGDSAPVVAADGSTHRTAQLLADGLHALACVAAPGTPLPPVGVTYPAHWPATDVRALRAALDRVPEWSQQPVCLLSDVAATLTALQADPGLPDGGVIAVCDFGGSGTSITLIDATRGHRSIGANIRYTDFSGDFIDQVLLDRAVARISAVGPLHGRFAIGSLGKLRRQCRSVKERLSTDVETELQVDMPGFSGGVHFTRADLDEVIAQPLDGFLDTLQETLVRNKIPSADLAAIVAVGGRAHLPPITDGLSHRFGVEVIRSPQPHLTAAVGAAMRAERDAGDNDAVPTSAFVDELPPDETWRGRITRRSVAVVVSVIAALLAVGAVTAIALRNGSADEPATSIPGETTVRTTEPWNSQTGGATEPPPPESEVERAAITPEPTTNPSDWASTPEPTANSPEPTSSVSQSPTPSTSPSTTPTEQLHVPPAPHIPPGSNTPPGPNIPDAPPVR